jgi:hypothetical protein
MMMMMMMMMMSYWNVNVLDNIQKIHFDSKKMRSLKVLEIKHEKRRRRTVCARACRP